MSEGISNNIDNVVPSSKGAAPKKTPEKLPLDQAAETSAKNQLILEWSGKTFDFKEKGGWWYAIAGLVILAGIGYFIWQQQWFLVGITVIVSAVLFWYIRSVRPQNESYQITTFGVQVGGQFYPYNEIHSFWIIYNEKVKTLNIVFAKKYLPTLTIDLTEVDPNQVRLILARRVPEQSNRTESILDRLVRALQL